uniref:Integrase, catalytic region, zinc finger, CCHC-type, peptidase aspartic, catalytic n=1 Tax=Tanacetum cinerariifolium TaxID=118510 RepID=A0A6L2KF94_TANCI|nr:integrase, catalytic region, zinc finger, CCHC-type, peptidase aspartic, catalytic [Tanacetum cinerariifolium]
MSRDVLTVGSTMRIHLLYQGEYSQWSERFMNYIEEKTDGEAMINSIKNGDQPLPRVTQVSIAGTSSTKQPPLKDKSMWSDQEKKIQEIDRLARFLLIQGLPNDIYSLIDNNKTAKNLWAALARQMLGFKYGEQDSKAAVLYGYETLKLLKENYNYELNFKFLNNLQPEWKHYATMMRQNKNLMDINIDALYNILKQNQGDVNDAMALNKIVMVTSDPLAWIAEKKKIEKVLSDPEASSSSSDDKIVEVSYYTSKSENHNESDVTHNDSEDVAKLIIQMIKEFDKKIAKYQKCLEKANQQNKDFKNQNKDLQDKYDVLKNQATTFEEKNNELNEQIKVLVEKNADLLAQINVLKEQLKVKHVVIDTHAESQEKYAKLEEKRYDFGVDAAMDFKENILRLDQVVNTPLPLERKVKCSILTPYKAGGPFLPLVEPEAASLALVGVGLSTSQPPPYTVEDATSEERPIESVEDYFTPVVEACESSSRVLDDDEEEEEKEEAAAKSMNHFQYTPGVLEVDYRCSPVFEQGIFEINESLGGGEVKVVRR